MGWKYDLEPSDEGFRIVERYDDDCYTLLDQFDWWYESKEDAIETLEMILKDLKGEKQDEAIN